MIGRGRRRRKERELMMGSECGSSMEFGCNGRLPGGRRCKKGNKAVPQCASRRTSL